MSILKYIVPKDEACDLIKQLLFEEFHLNDGSLDVLYERFIKPHFDVLRDDIYFFAETNYVDRVYRDSYYYYYSSKLNSYNRNCMRISVFDGEIDDDDFFDSDKCKILPDRYLGFYVLRPTSPYIIGRSVISPKALKNSGMRTCTANFNTTSNGLVFQVNGFPHSSQDTETISCAETSLWAVMEYFGNKYPYYKPVMPSEIIEKLNDISFERQVPSKGLNIQQISFALKKFGFGTKIYSSGEYGDEFEKLLSCYVESGIPLIVAMENKTGCIRHALLVVGREIINADAFDALQPYVPQNADLQANMIARNVVICDYDSLQKRFVFVDDNRPVYQMATLADPAAHYGGDWCDCRITYFIAPLYPKIYLEAFEARNYIISFLIYGPQPIANNQEIVLKVYLASSRSYKNELATNASFTEDVKYLVMEAEMPKFIWVAEISTKELIKQGLANGLVIVDATEPNIHFNKPLILAIYEGSLLTLDGNFCKLQRKAVHLPSFSIYEHNLNAFE